MMFAVQERSTDANCSEPEAARQVDRRSFSILIREHHRGLLTYARALTREEHNSRDLVQDAFVVAWKNLETFDVTRDFGSWMRGIVRNKWRESLRRQVRQVDVDDEKLEYLEADVASWYDPDSGTLGALMERLERCMKKLPDGLSTAVKSYYYDGCSGEETAALLQVRSATVRKRLERARLSLRQCLQSRAGGLDEVGEITHLNN